MPIPNPRQDETQDEFVGRCMGSIGTEYDQKQALAICYDKWDKKNYKMTPDHREMLSSFVGRCVKDDKMKKIYPDRPERAMMCYGYYQQKYSNNIGKKWK